MKNIRTFLLFPLILAFPIIGPSCTVSQPDGNVYKTFDEGETWNQKITIEGDTNDLSETNVKKLLLDPYNSDVVFLISKEKGLFVSNTFGDSWKQILPETSTVYDIEPSYFTQGVFFASILLNDRGKIIYSENGGTDWKEIYTEAGIGTYISFVKSDPFIRDSLVAVNSVGLLIRSLDKGNTWKPLHSFEEPVISLVMDKDQVGSIYSLTKKGVWHSNNGGINFNQVKLDSEMGYDYLLLEKEGGRLYLQTEKGFYRSEDEGKIWKKIVTLNNPSEFPVNTISFFPNNSRNKWVLGAGMTLYITQDDGITFKAIQFDITKEIGSIIIKPNDTNQMLIGVKTINRNTISAF